MAKVYRFTLKNQQGEEELIKLDYFPYYNMIYKTFEVDKDSEAAQTFEWMFNQKEFKEQLKKEKELKSYFRKIGIRFGKDGKVIKNDSFVELSTQWMIVIDLNEEEEDSLVSITAVLDNYPFAYYRKDILEKYCKEEIDKLLNAGLIEEIEVEDK